MPAYRIEIEKWVDGFKERYPEVTFVNAENYDNAVWNHYCDFYAVNDEDLVLFSVLSVTEVKP